MEKEYGVASLDDMEKVDLSQVEEIPPDLTIQDVNDELGIESMNVKVWYFEPGEGIGYHAHSEQEELFYIVQGEFSLKLGRSGEEEYVEAGPGTLWAADALIGHGHRYEGDDTGIVLAFGAPPVEDRGRDPHQIDDGEIDESR
ncbi:MAG: cupin domain-containing protein [Haloarculaceae archaeon]